MASFDPAVTNTLLQEGGFFHNEATGEVANYGITLKFLRNLGILQSAGPASLQDIQVVRTLTEQDAEKLYFTYIWTPNQFADILDQGVANKLFDLTVNMGGGDSEHPGAITIAQQTINQIQPATNLVTDGNLGPHSRAALNGIAPNLFLSRYRLNIAARYREIAAGHPSLAGDLLGWLERLAA